MPVDAKSVKGGRRSLPGGSKPWLCCAAASILASCYCAKAASAYAALPAADAAALISFLKSL